MAFNKVILEGNLTRAPELKYTSGKGTPVAKAGIAINRISNVNGERREEVCFVDLTFWGRTAEIANQYLQKGSKVLIEGHLVLEQWQDQNGQNRSKHSVTVETLDLIGSKEGGNGGVQGGQMGFDGGYDDGGYSRNSSYNSYGANQSYPQNQGYSQNFGNQGANQGYNGGYNQGYQQNTPNQNFANGSFGGGGYNNQNPAAQKPAQSVAPKEEKLPEYDVDKDEIPF